MTSFEKWANEMLLSYEKHLCEYALPENQEPLTLAPMEPQQLKALGAMLACLTQQQAVEAQYGSTFSPTDCLPPELYGDGSHENYTKIESQCEQARQFIWHTVDQPTPTML